MSARQVSDIELSFSDKLSAVKQLPDETPTTAAETSVSSTTGEMDYLRKQYEVVVQDSTPIFITRFIGKP